ncbi:alpha-glucan family phosphorylase [bacterium]|nr:alpha-glucan family phosphorylase [bacterium]
MHILGTIVVRPVLPQRIARLHELSRNLWWSWDPRANALFARLGGKLWDELNHNPVAMLSHIDQTELEKAAGDKEFLQLYDQVMGEFDAYMHPKTTRFTTRFPQHQNKVIAYFSAEFGLHESLPIYSGGLGILSGDHMKTASDMGIPIVGIGLMYNQGYFIQRLNGDGWQEAIYNTVCADSLPLEKALDSQGNEIIVNIEMPGRDVSARVWLVQVGRNKLYLLDTQVDGNSVEDRNLSAKLYGGDNGMRIAQEKILGIGGVRALRRLGITPWVWHMNEGHSAFLTIELMREMVEGYQLTWREAIEAVTPSVCFTTHTPVPAGQDAFSADLIEQHFYSFFSRLGMNRHEFMRLGQKPHDPNGPFNLTMLALKLSSHRNGVSKLHGKVSRHLWHEVWPELALAEVPITHVTNGVHIGTWVASSLSDLYDRHLGTRWHTHPDDKALWENASIPHNELWETHNALKAKMIEHARTRIRRRMQRNGYPIDRINDVDNWLSPNVLTIGFARRFATYKRAVLLFSDLERLKKIMFQPGREVNFVFAGKAHPADDPGKRFIQRIHELSEMPEFRGHIVLLEDYDINLARHLVQGVDVWLNNPRRPLEASGTSGEKAAINGVLNFSVLDGWWAEGYDGSNGWAIGTETRYSSEAEQDVTDSTSIYTNLEDNIVPLYYERNEQGIPDGWVERMMNSIRTLLPNYCTHRMLHDYNHTMYMPAGEYGERMRANHFAQARTLASWLNSLEYNWNEVRLEADMDRVSEISKGQEVGIRVRAYLGKLQPEDVRVELYAGPMQDGEIYDPIKVELNYSGYRDGSHHYEGTAIPERTGTIGCAIRVLPIHPALERHVVTNFVQWAH